LSIGYLLGHSQQNCILYKGKKIFSKKLVSGYQKSQNVTYTSKI
jgi:hypothetical protein